MTTSYYVFGLHLRTNLPLPGSLSPTSLNNPPEVALHLSTRPYPAEENARAREELTYTSCDSGQTGSGGLCIWRVVNKGLLHITYPDGTQFWLDDKRENVWATWPASSSLEETSTYLLGPIFGLLLRLRGITCLHASGVNLGGKGIAFLGIPGAGKSTTAAAFARDGHAVLSDDIVPLVEREGSFHMMPAYPHLSLWPDSVNMLYGSPDALPRFTPNWEKRCLVLGEKGTLFQSRPVPLAAIYILGEHRPVDTPFVQAVRPRPALLSLVADTYANRILDREMRAREFEVLANLVSRVPVRQVCAPNGVNCLEEVCRVIYGDLTSLGDPSAAHP